MTNSTYKRRHLFGCRVREGKSLVAKQRQGGSNNLRDHLLIHKQERERFHTGNGLSLWKHQNLSLVTHLLQQGQISESFPNISTNWRASIQVYETIGGHSPSNGCHPFFVIIIQAFGFWQETVRNFVMSLKISFQQQQRIIYLSFGEVRINWPVTVLQMSFLMCIVVTLIQ